MTPKDDMEAGSCFENFDFDVEECKVCALAKQCKDKTMDIELLEMTSAPAKEGVPEMPS